MSKHTPGPWKCVQRDIGGPGLCHKVISEQDRQEVATVGRWDGKGDESNARLIAAAPELLEACGRVLREFNQANPNWANVANECAAAIAKAEGR